MITDGQARRIARQMTEATQGAAAAFRRLIAGIGIPTTPYIRPVVTAVNQLEYELTRLYDRNWRLSIERESPGVWRCRWDILTPDGDVLGGGSESFTVNT